MDHFKSGTRTLAVDMINGRPLEAPISKWIDNTAALPRETRIVLRGYEDGRVIGGPDQQAERQFWTYFRVTEVVEPESLLIAED